MSAALPARRRAVDRRMIRIVVLSLAASSGSPATRDAALFTPVRSVRLQGWRRDVARAAPRGVRWLDVRQSRGAADARHAPDSAVRVSDSAAAIKRSRCAFAADDDVAFSRACCISSGWKAAPVFRRPVRASSGASRGPREIREPSRRMSCRQLVDAARCATGDASLTRGWWTRAGVLCKARQARTRPAAFFAPSRATYRLIVGASSIPRRRSRHRARLRAARERKRRSSRRRHPHARDWPEHRARFPREPRPRAPSDGPRESRALRVPPRSSRRARDGDATQVNRAHACDNQPSWRRYEKHEGEGKFWEVTL